MFDLEKAVGGWKKSMGGSQSIQDGDLAELEAYLRDKVEDLVGRGMSEEEAFHQAETEFSRADRLDGDYSRAHALRSVGRLPWQARRIAPALSWTYLIIALRKIRRQKEYAVLTIGSLALALAVGLLTIGWVQYETSYDGFHKNAPTIHRFLYQWTRGSNITETTTSVPYALPFIIKETFPEVVAASRVMKIRPGTRLESPKLIDYRASVAFVDPDFLTMFDFPLVKGDPRTAFVNSKSVLLTESAAGKFFGADEPVGKILLSQESKVPLMVTGVLKNIPETSHLDFDLLMGMSDLSLWYEDNLKPDDWLRLHTDLYVQLAPGTNIAALENNVTRLANDRNPKAGPRLLLQPLREIHLRSDRLRSFLSDRRRDTVTMLHIRIFLFVALAVLFMGCINYVNLATARALKRAKEIAVRKVNGAGKADLIKQFLGESVLFAFVALAVAFFLAALIGLPILRRLTGLSFDLALLDKGRLLLAFLGLTLLTGLLSGLYPAFFVSSLPSVNALKECFKHRRLTSIYFRRLLVAVQIVCSATLISVIAVLVLQLRYMDRKDLGFKRDSLLVIRNDVGLDRIASLKSDLLSHSTVRGVATGFLPTMGEAGHLIQNQENLSWEGKSPEAQIQMDWQFVDEDYLKTYGLELVQGRFFSKDILSDKKNYVLNETAVRAMGIKDPVGKLFGVNGRSGQIIGVIKDFHVGTLKAEIRPMYFSYASGYFSLVVQIDIRNTAAAIGHIAAIMKKYDPDRPLEYSFLDEILRRMYNGERRNARLISIFGIISVVISCLGLFGLISFMAEQRTKEIGVRKVLGASVIRIIRMMSTEFALLVIIAVVVAVPLGYAIASRWLAEFAYRINLSWWIFAGAGLIVFALTLATMGLRTVQAARANPVNSLRYE